MVDMFPFPKITGETAEKQIAEIYDYLIQFKEILEFALMNISIDNLSPDLIAKLNELGADIEQNKNNREEAIAQISNNTLTIGDVCNSDMLKDTITNEVESITFSVNFNTGYLEFATS